MPSRTLLALSALLLVAAVGLVIYGKSRPQVRTFHGKLTNVLPEAPPGWERTLRPIADTPEMQKAVGEMLNYNDAVFADYTRGSDRLSVYAAYWRPGRMSYRLVAGHTPDVCWIVAGWRCTSRGETIPKVSGISLHGFPAETRTFTARGATEYVWFWHIVGGRPISYGPQTPPWYSSLADMVANGFDQRKEQFFIRLSAPRPLDDPALASARDTVLGWVGRQWKG